MTIADATMTQELESLVLKAERLIERRDAEASALTSIITANAAESGTLRNAALADYINAFYQCLVENNYDQAISLCSKALKNYTTEELKGIDYKIYMTLGNAFQLKGEPYTAQLWYIRGLRQLEGGENLLNSEKVFLGTFYYNLSILFTHTERNNSGEEYLKRAIDLFEKTRSKFKLSKSYSAYANILEDRKEYKRAVDLMFKALQIDIAINDAYSIALSKANIGILYSKIYQTDLAIEYLDAALIYYSGERMLHETALVKFHLGKVLSTSGNKERGIALLKEVEIKFEELSNKNELTQVYLHLSDALSNTGDYKTSLDYHRKYVASLKETFDGEKANEITRLKHEFETEIKDKEAALLKEKNEETSRYAHRLEISNNELKQFAHVAAHDLREPLRMINAYMSLLSQSLKLTLTSQQKEFIGFAVDGAKRMDVLIQNMLRLAKVDAAPRIELVNLDDVIAEVKLNLAALIVDKNAVIEHQSGLKINADRTQILQLFQNIIGNGIKYNENGQPKIVITHKRKIEGNKISITDNGIGIPLKYREKAFEIFQRVPTQKEYGGSGIGLAICKKIVDSLKGRIWIKESSSQGTTFSILIP